MEKRVPKSDKYSHIQGTLNTGLTVEKVKNVTASEYAKRRDEIFFRINKNQVYELFNEYEASEYESIADSSRSRDLKIVTHNQSDSPVYDKPYLILDVRDVGDFNTCHLLQARSFPYTLLRRDQLHPEIYKFRNKTETLIIVYCDDEKISRDAAKVLVDRGTDNIYLLTGGMEEFSQLFPAFLEGVPPSPKNSPVKQQSSSSSTWFIFASRRFVLI
jgi:centrosomal protein CEP41